MDSQTPMLLLGGLLLLVVGADLLVRGASRLAVLAGISPLVVGLTVVSLGTSAPELAVSVHSALGDETSLALGNVVGSNVSNVLLVLGVGALVRPLGVAQKVVRLEVPLILLVSGVVLLLARDGRISRLEGAGLVAVSTVYTLLLIRGSRRESLAVEDEYAREYQREAAPSSLKVALLRQGGMVLGGLLCLVLGARGLVSGALDLALHFGLSELVAGLTIVAVGTSLPEVATVVIASLKGERDIAVGNVVGSNLYNLLVVLGLGAVAAPSGMEVPPAALRFDLWVMLAVSFVCLPIFLTGFRVARWEGALFLAYFVAYVAFLVMDSQGHAALPAFSWNVMVFLIPLSLLAVGLSVVHSLRRRARGQGW